MGELQMGVIESRFADLIWENEPMPTGELAKRSLELLNWKKTTSYTVLKRLCDKGIFENNKGWFYENSKSDRVRICSP